MYPNDLFLAELFFETFPGESQKKVWIQIEAIAAINPFNIVWTGQTTDLATIALEFLSKTVSWYLYYRTVHWGPQKTRGLSILIDQT